MEGAGEEEEEEEMMRMKMKTMKTKLVWEEAVVTSMEMEMVMEMEKGERREKVVRAVKVGKAVLVEEEEVLKGTSIHSNNMYGSIFTKIFTIVRRRTRRKRRGAQRQKLPNKPTDFQVRVHVLEARKLVGSGLNPVVKVACGKDMQQTSTQKGTNNPVFDEVSRLPGQPPRGALVCIIVYAALVVVPVIPRSLPHTRWTYSAKTTTNSV